MYQACAHVLGRPDVRGCTGFHLFLAMVFCQGILAFYQMMNWKKGRIKNSSKFTRAFHVSCCFHVVVNLPVPHNPPPGSVSTEHLPVFKEKWPSCLPTNMSLLWGFRRHFQKDLGPLRCGGFGSAGWRWVDGPLEEVLSLVVHRATPALDWLGVCSDRLDMPAAGAGKDGRSC